MIDAASAQGATRDRLAPLFRERDTMSPAQQTIVDFRNDKIPSGANLNEPAGSYFLKIMIS
jgi:hypothetical protein